MPLSSRATRKRAGEDVSGEQHDHLLNQPVSSTSGPVNHDPNYGMEEVNEVALATQHTGQAEQEEAARKRREQADAEYHAWLDEYQSKVDRAMSGVDDEDEETKKKRERAERTRMKLAGIGDAANAFHQAYSYAAGIKPMEGSEKSLSERTRKEIMEEKKWREHNRDRLLNYEAMRQRIEEARRKDYYEGRKDENSRMVAESNVRRNDAMANQYNANAELTKQKKDDSASLTKSQVNANNARANASNAQAEKTRKGGGTGSGKTGKESGKAGKGSGKHNRSLGWGKEKEEDNNTDW